MTTFTNQIKHNSTFTTGNIDFNSVYGVARYGISTYGTGTQGSGLFTDATKHNSTFTNQTKH